MNPMSSLKKINMGQVIQNRQLLLDCLKQEELELPSQLKRKKIDLEKKHLVTEISLQNKHLLRDLRLQ